MKGKNLIAVLTFFSFTAHAQFKVDNIGHVGIGTPYPNPDNQLMVVKNQLICNPAGTTFQQMVFETLGTAAGNPRIWTTNGSISFYSQPYNNYMYLYAKGYYTISDSTLKSDITKLNYGLKDVMKLNPVQYSLKSTVKLEEDKVTETASKEFGFLSQEVRKTFPSTDITRFSEGYLLMDYDQLIPVLVKAIQEQQGIIEKLSDELESVKSNRLTTNSVPSDQKNKLFQNEPNPFSAQTKIRFKLASENVRSAEIVVFNLLGELQRTYPIRNFSDEFVIVEGNDLKPGKYLYSLIVNNTEVETKNMILLGN
jgi:hypothetical protein